MKELKPIDYICGVMALCVTQPLWFYLLYRILKEIGATELTWFVFWIYVPAAIITRIIINIANKAKE